jgi:hypothetical protein
LREAERLGYRPDPFVAQLMNHIRSRRIRHTQANLGLLMLNDDEYVSRLTSGVQRRAEELGYAVDKIAIEPFAGNSAGLTRMLRARGIEGLLLPPCRPPRSLASLLDWTQFSAVAMTYSISEPRLDRVVPHHFHNAMLLLRRLREQGYRRPMFALHCDLDSRANHAYSAAIAWTAVESGRPAIPPLLSPELKLRGIGAWVARHRPDAIVVGSMAQIERDLRPELGAPAMKRLGLAVLDCQARFGIAGVDQQTHLVGSAAVDMLVAQLQRRAHGAPLNPVVSMVEGAWVGDPVFHTRSIKAGKPAKAAAPTVAA